MSRYHSCLIAIAGLAATLCLPEVGRAAKDPLQYNRDIRPILSDRCFKCHGPDKASRKASLRLDVAEEAYAERKKKGKFAIVPGKPESSLVCVKIFSTDPDEQMPPPESNLSLSAAEKATIRRWITEGAKYQPHWAFIPPADSVPVPPVKNKKWVRNEIDNYILSRLEKAGLNPSPEAGPARWLRRVSYDLSGLPPTPEQIESFLADKSPGAYEKVVDRLLASPHFGERMAVPWLDAARYADSYGYQSDQLCPTWPYRDWVVRAYNRNLPYDQFVTEQIAGDLLPRATDEQRLATAFNRLHRQTNEGGSIEEEWRNEYVSDRVNTFSTAVMALTFECARCHDHKYDPILQRDYYSLGSFFNSIDEYGLYNDMAHVPTPSLLLPKPEQSKSMADTQRALTEKRSAYSRVASGIEKEFSEWLKSADSQPEIPGLKAKYDFDEINGTNQFSSASKPAELSSPLHGNQRIDGKSGKAVRFNGDDEITFPNLAGGLQPWEPYSIVFWVKIPAALTNAVLFHRLEGTDTGFHGTELCLDNSRLLFVIKRFWPGNALAIRATQPVAFDRWVQIGVTYDGAAQAEGMALFSDGKRLEVKKVRDHLYKSPQNGGNGVSFGALFRSTGLKGGALDDLSLYNRSLSPIEIQQLFDQKSLAQALEKKDAALLKPYYLAAISTSAKHARAEVSEAVKQYYAARDSVAEISVMEEMPEPRPAFVLARGRYDAPKTDDRRVARTVPAFLSAFPNHAGRDRLGLAKWLTSPQHPLTARVAVNRYWQLLFGRGIVATPENFGAQGAEPTHPELLDWLARDFIRSNWDTKAMLKKIVLSATYRQDSRLRPDLREKDPENLLLARGPSFRLPAEMIRDTALAASSLLEDKVGGPPVSPYSPGDLWRESNSMSPAYHQSVGEDLYRRSLYTVWKRTAPMPDMTAFDAPSREVCVIRRSATITPQQAFVMLNDPQFVEAARVLAERAMEQGGSAGQQIRFIFLRLAAREPSAKELDLLKDSLREQSEIFAKEPDRAEKLVNVGEHKHKPGLDTIQLAAMTAVAQATLNLDATVWKR